MALLNGWAISLRSCKASMADRAIIVRFEGQSFGPARLRDRVFNFFYGLFASLLLEQSHG